MNISSKKIAIVAGFIFLVAGSAYFLSQWILAEQQVKAISKEIKTGQVNEKVLSFSKLLTTTVLSGSKEVSFDDRLKLENSVRDLDDKEIFSQWQRFTQSTTGEESQQSFTDLLKLLLKKISY